MTEDDIQRIFTHHPPKDQYIAQKHQNVRSITLHAALWFYNNLPESAERTLAIRKLQEAMMYANSAIAQHSDRTGLGT